MIRRKEEMKSYDRPEMKGGAGKAVLTDLLDASEMMGKGRLFSTYTRTRLFHRQPYGTRARPKSSIFLKAKPPRMTTAQKPF